MKFFGIHLDDLESEAFAMASDAQVTTWLFLHAYCCKKLNGGRIEDAGTIPAKLWLRHGIGHHDILKEPSPLWEWDGGTLRVMPYDMEGQSLWEKKSKAGRSTAEKRWGKNSSATRSANSSATSSADSSHDASDQSNSSTRAKQTVPPKSPKGEPLRLPHNSAFAEAWPRWVKHRSEIRKPLKPTQIDAQLKKLASMTEAEAVAIINHTIEMGWQGLREPENTGKGKNRELKASDVGI